MPVIILFKTQQMPDASYLQKMFVHVVSEVCE